MYSQILQNLIIPLKYFFFQINAKNTTIKLQYQISWKCLSTNEMLKIVLYLRYYNKIKQIKKRNTKMYLTVKKNQNSNQKNRRNKIDATTDTYDRSLSYFNNK